MHQDHGIIGNILRHPISFSVVFLILFGLTVGFLGAMDALPEPSSKAEVVQKEVKAKTVETSTPENPALIKIATLGLDVLIKNPTSANVDVLDAALSTGAVRYPTSAQLGVNGTVLLFGHNSNLPVIVNPAYKAFRGIQTLPKGAIISVYSATREYRYSVTSVRVANANEDVIELRKDGKYLTLVTCDSITSKASRFVVEAKFVGAYPLTSN
jgi:LPXTG-site transpeptidase (sortase) family protein